MKRSNIRIAVMGSSQIEHIIPLLSESGYHVTDIQTIFSSNKTKEEKEERPGAPCPALHDLRLYLGKKTQGIPCAGARAAPPESGQSPHGAIN